MAYKLDLSGSEQKFLKIAALSTAILAVVGLFKFYKNDVWKPKIKVINVDYDNAEAELMVNDKKMFIKGESPYAVNYLGGTTWSVKLGTSYIGNGIRVYDRIELLNNGTVSQIINEAV